MPRFGFPLQDVTQLHADIGWFTGALAVALAIGLWFTCAPASAVRASRIVLIGLGVQGTIGYAQYFSHLPAGLVWVHVAMSVVLWVFVLRLYLSTRERQPVPAADGTPAQWGGAVARLPAGLRWRRSHDNAEASTGRGQGVAPGA